MELRLLRSFQALAQQGHFGRAAPSLHVSQPALTKQMRQLEEEIGDLKAALLFDFATRADYRALVKQEFDGTQALFSDYIKALGPAYPVPVVKDP